MAASEGGARLFMHLYRFCLHSPAALAALAFSPLSEVFAASEADLITAKSLGQDRLKASGVGWRSGRGRFPGTVSAGTALYLLVCIIIPSRSPQTIHPLQGFVVRLRGLPYNASALDVLKFFSGVDVVRGIEGVVFTYAADGR